MGLDLWTAWLSLCGFGGSYEIGAVMEVLVLDRDFAPVARVGWRKAISKILKGKAEVIEEYEDREVSCGQWTWKMPSIIRIFRQVAGLFRRGVRFNRKNIYLRDHGTCQFCGTKVAVGGFTFDHVIPRDQGGKTVWENIVASCFKCNQKKKNRTPKQAGMELLSKPVRPKTLNGTLDFIGQESNIPQSWKDFLASIGYWTLPLDSD